MNALRWPQALTPSQLAAGLREEVQRLLEELRGRGADTRVIAQGGGWAPPADIMVTPSALVFRLDVPGLARSALKITVRDRVLTVRGEREFREPGGMATIVRAERARGAFERSFRLEETVGREGVSARYSDGVLEIVVARSRDGGVLGTGK